MTWLEFAGVFAAFFVSHSVPTRPKVRARLVRVFGPKGFTLAYSLLSLVMLAALILAANRAPFVSLWPQAAWQYHIAQAGMFGVCVVLVFTFGQVNPFSFGGAQTGSFDPSNAGIMRWMRHPILVALGLWGAVHLLPNGDLAHVLLFGIFAGFSIMGMKLIDRRKRREMGAAHWESVLRELRAQPLMKRPSHMAGIALRLWFAGALYGALLVFHSFVIGVSVSPF